jgi:hypothetical protein
MENAASVEIRVLCGFPPPLGKVTLNSGATFPHFPQALLVFFFNKIKTQAEFRDLRPWRWCFAIVELKRSYCFGGGRALPPAMTGEKTCCHLNTS